MNVRNGRPKIWLDYDQEALDRQYDQRVLVPEANDYIARNRRDSAEVRARLNCRLDVAYGPSPDETLDIFPAGDNTPVVIYVHGGAWTRWSKDENSYQAPVFVNAGVAFVSVNFALAPQVSLDELVDQNRTTVKWIYDHARDFGADPNQIYIWRHSSGAHVVGLLAVSNWAADLSLPTDVIKGAIAVSGMYDLEPVRLSSRNTYLHLDDAAVERNSTLRNLPDKMPPMIIAYGGQEQIEFQRQSREFAKTLQARGDDCQLFFYNNNNHFEMAQEFANPTSPLTTAAIQMMGLFPYKIRGLEAESISELAGRIQTIDSHALF